MRLSLFYVDPDYIAYLQLYDRKVPIVEKIDAMQARPLVGIVVSFEESKFYAPLTSPKPKHASMKDSISFIKIDDGALGAINLNNMIPVRDSQITKIDIVKFPQLTQADIKYKKLLENQLSWCNKTVNRKRITQSSEQLIRLIYAKEADPGLLGICCDFELLVEKCKDYE
jgi:protein AbiQ